MSQIQDDATLTEAKNSVSAVQVPAPDTLLNSKSPGDDASLQPVIKTFTEILSLLISHSLQGLFRLHDSDSVRETFQILCQAPPIGALLKPLAERLRRARGKVRILDVVREFDNGLRP